MSFIFVELTNWLEKEKHIPREQAKEFCRPFAQLKYELLSYNKRNKETRDETKVIKFPEKLS